VNAQFVGVERKDTVLYYAARKASGADNKSFSVKSGVSGHFLGVSQYGVNAQNIRAEHLVITSNNEALLVGTMMTQIRPGFSSERTMLLRTNLNGDSLGMTSDVSCTFPQHAAVIYNEVVVSGTLYTRSSGTRMAISGYKENGDSLGNQKLETLPILWDASEGKTIKTLDRGSGNRLTLAARGPHNGTEVLLLAYKQDFNPSGDSSATETAVKNVETIPEVSLYPNPVVDQLFVQGSLREDLVVTIMAPTGAIVLKTETSNNIISVASLQTGLFIVNIQNEEGQVLSTQRIIKM
jgi:hypothetical protein